MSCETKQGKHNNQTVMFIIVGHYHTMTSSVARSPLLNLDPSSDSSRSNGT